MTLRRRGVYHHWRRIETHERSDCYGVGHNELLIREGLANRNRDKLLRSVKFGAARSGAGVDRLGHAGRRGQEMGRRARCGGLVFDSSPATERGVSRAGVRRESGGRSGSSQRAALVVAHGLLDFLPGVHHERSVLHDRLA